MADETSEAYFRRLVDEDALRAYLEAHLGAADEYAVERHAEGHSNETLFVTWGDAELVLRRPPPGETAETAHDVLREYRVIDALQDTPVRVPTTVLACDDHSVIGSDFYLMERLAGDVLRDAEPERFATPAHRERVGMELVDALAEIHAVDYEAVGLGEFGHPPGYTQRQVDRWGKQYAWAFEVTEAEREVPAAA
jgi:aminoglycoside phosphotransferase (APT) family kinase protein